MATKPAQTVNLLFYFGLMIAGGAGALLRYGLARLYSNQAVFSLPFATALANFIGCFAMGYLATFFVDRGSVSSQIQTIVLTGFLGGFTTFSAFSLEAVSMMESGVSLKAIFYVISQVVICLFLCFAGILLAKNLHT